ncbi:MAG: hypothetical protein IJR49_05790, partial [Treponema sp.]|nr:hypothetical protein [Treponema sp.]
IVKIHDYVKDRSNDIDSQKNRVDTVAQKFDKLIDLSEVMDGKIQELNTTYDQLQNMELAARDFQEKLVELSASYDRLEQKQDVLDHVTNDVNTSFENLKELETGLKACERQLNSLPKEIKLLQTNVDKILKNGPKIAAAAEKLDDLHSLLDDADKRVKVINSAREGLGRSEARLEELNADIDAKFKLLGQITKKDLEKNPTKGETRLSPRDTENIRTLKRQGWTIAQIAKRMNRTQTEVSLALELSDD